MILKQGLIEVLSRHLSGVTEERNEKPHSGHLLSAVIRTEYLANTSLERYSYAIR
jgi:hypothetical protein